MNPSTPDEFEALHDQAYADMERGALREAAQAFEALAAHHPHNRHYHYMLGLAHKYLRDWPQSLQRNLHSIDMARQQEGAPDEASLWNGAIAATALADWATARRLWSDCGIQVPGAQGPIEGDYGVAVVRLNPWQNGETVFMRRIDPVRAQLLNVPLPESGHRFGDIVLHDGASTGQRHSGARQVPVFNALQRLQASAFQTFVVFITCGGPQDLRALLDAEAPGIGYAEDWTASIRSVCLRCSYGAPHSHGDGVDAQAKTDADADADADTAWEPQRNLGIAAHGREAVDALLGAWVAGGAGRQVDAVQTRECPVPEDDQTWAWWVGPESETPQEEGGDEDDGDEEGGA